MVLLLVAIDVACLTVALLTAYALRFGFLPDAGYMTGLLVGVTLWPVPFYALGLYTRHLSGPEALRRTIAAAGSGMVVLIVVSFWLDFYASRSWIAITLVLALILELTARMI